MQDFITMPLDIDIAAVDTISLQNSIRWFLFVTLSVCIAIVIIIYDKNQLFICF